MNFKAKLLQNSSSSWAISLSTHLGSIIPNEPCDPDVQVRGYTAERVKRVDQLYANARVRSFIAGYNCFGHVFASRRTAVYDDMAKWVQAVLVEDGFGKIAEQQKCCEDDVVIYCCDDEAIHVAKVVRFESLIVRSLGEVNAPARTPIVLSKFFDFSGEYEHPIGDTKWAEGCYGGHVSYSVYRARLRTPQRWANKIMGK